MSQTLSGTHRVITWLLLTLNLQNKTTSLIVILKYKTVEDGKQKAN